MNMPVKPPRLSFILTTWEGGGSVPPVLTVAEKLVSRGHSVRIMSDAVNRPESEAVGARFVAWTGAPSRTDKGRASDPMRDWEAASPQEGMMRVIDEVLAGPAAAYAADLLEELTREPADLVVSSEMLLGVHAACEHLGQPYVLLGCQICIFPLPGSPPFGGGLPPAGNDAERELLAQIRQGAVQLFDHGLPALNAARAGLGLPAVAHVHDQIGSAPALLLATSEAFDFPWTSKPANIHYVGPQISDPAWAEPWTTPWPADDKRPLVLVGFSTSFQDHIAVLQRVVDALGQLPVRVLVTTGAAIDPSELTARDNTVVVASAPHVAVMREASLVVTHGGHGTLIRALAQGLPQLVIPHGRDQNDNACRIAHRGAGLTLMPSATTAEIHDALRRLIEEPAFAEAARRLGAAVAQEARNSPIIAELEAAASAAAEVGA
jgi:MGT family glycosyltransferase